MHTQALEQQPKFITAQVVLRQEGWEGLEHSSPTRSSIQRLPLHTRVGTVPLSCQQHFFFIEFLHLLVIKFKTPWDNFPTMASARSFWNR